MIKLNITLPSGGGIAIEADDRELVREVLYSAMPHLLGASPADGVGGDGVGDGINNGNGAGGDSGAVLGDTVPASDGSGVSVNSHNGHSEGGIPSGLQGVDGDGRAFVPAGYPAPPEAVPSVPAGYPIVAPTPVAPSVPAQPYLPPSEPGPAAVAPVAAPAAPSPSAMPVASAGVAPAPSAALSDAILPAGATPGSPAERAFAEYCQQVNPLGDMRKVVVAAEAAARYLDLQSVDPDRLAALFTLAGWPIPHSFVQTLRNAARSKFRWMERVAGLNGHYRVSDVGRSIVLGENGAG